MQMCGRRVMCLLAEAITNKLGKCGVARKLEAAPRRHRAIQLSRLPHTYLNAP